MTAKPQPPEPSEPDKKWEYYELWASVKDALLVLPSLFESDLVISGVRATDLFSFNASLGATIEEKVVDGLNQIRDATWDKDGRYAHLRFVRQAQTFPDVVLKPAAAPQESVKPVLGVELKGWYALAKEGVPSFRYTVTPKAAAPADLLAVYPWALSRVISGTPELFDPFVVSAQYVAEYRNWWWQYEREAKGDRSIRVSDHEGFYPMKSDLIADVPAHDAGNFGRIARTGIFERDGYSEALFREDLAGIPLYAWLGFLKLFSEGNAEDRIRGALQRMEREVTKAKRPRVKAQASAIEEKLRELSDLIADL